MKQVSLPAAGEEWEDGGQESLQRRHAGFNQLREFLAIRHKELRIICDAFTKIGGPVSVDATRYYKEEGIIGRAIHEVDQDIVQVERQLNELWED